jgi:two-component system, OmpR family, phosphate regulon sensor histidine kinase PhoR
MNKKRIIPDPILMSITILVVTGFQLYWLKNNYDREKRSLQIKANVVFQDAVRRLQTQKLRLKDPSFDTTHDGKMKIMVNEDFPDHEIRIRKMPRQEIVSMVDVIRDKVKDSLKSSRINSAIIVSMNKDSDILNRDSLQAKVESLQERVGNNRFFKFLFAVDSLQDSLKINEVTTNYQSRLNEEKISTPFKIDRIDKPVEINDDDLSNVTVGFTHPITYHLELLNTFPYIIKRLTLPILFSIFLVGVTIISFVLLYRNLLRQQRLSDLKNEFIGNITHELKTPIATVGVAIEALKNFNAMQDPERTKEYLDISENELQRLSLLVDKVLKLSMFEKKEIDLKYEILDLKDVVNEVVASMRLQIEKDNAKVSVTQEGDTNLEADRLHLLSIVFNLLDNALKYSKSGPSIHILMKGDDTNVQLSVSDNGIGIAAEYKNKIFENFFRVPTGDTHNAKGYGLGLSYVVHVVQKHNGKIHVDSELNKGTTITITLLKDHA